MKHLYAYITVVCLIACVCSCKQNDTVNKTAVSTRSKHSAQVVKSLKLPDDFDLKNIKTHQGTASLRYLNSLDMVKANVDAIVVGAPTQDFVNREHKTTYLPQDSGDDDTRLYVDSSWTRGPFVVSQVLYQKASSTPTITPGQTISLAEAVGLSYDPTNGGVRQIIENCTEIKQSSKYVAFIVRGTDGSYSIDNFNLGRFNTDGTDVEDELGVTNGTLSDGSKTGKQNLRDQVTAQYGITFLVPTTVAPSITTLAPSSTTSGATAFTLTVNGSDFKNGAVIQFGGKQEITTFLSATQLLAAISASEIATAGTVPVVVNNPDGKMSAAATFTVAPSVAGTGLRGTYYAGTAITGNPVGVRTDPQIAFNFGAIGRPGVGGLGHSNFSVEWQGTVTAPVAGAYTFATVSATDVSLSVNGVALITDNTDHAVKLDQATQSVTLTAGQSVPVDMQYTMKTGVGQAYLYWSYAGQPYQIVPQMYLTPAQ